MLWLLHQIHCSLESWAKINLFLSRLLVVRFVYLFVLSQKQKWNQARCLEHTHALQPLVWASMSMQKHLHLLEGERLRLTGDACLPHAKCLLFCSARETPQQDRVWGSLSSSDSLCRNISHLSPNGGATSLWLWFWETWLKSLIHLKFVELYSFLQKWKELLCI